MKEPRVRREPPTNSQRAPQASVESAIEVRGRAGFVLLLSLASFLLTLPIFAPSSFWPAGCFAFTPWLVAIAAAPRKRWTYIASYLFGVAFFLTHWRWLYSTTPPGYIAGSVFFALYFVFAAWPIRHLYRTRRLPLAFVFPIVWVLIEMIRSRGPLAFPWFLLGHSQIRLLPMVQIADITGVVGITFVLGMVNGLLADLIVRGIGKRGEGRAARDERVITHHSSLITHHFALPRQRIVLAGIVTALALLGTFVYGKVRLSSLTTTPGPKLAVIQGDFLLSPGMTPKEYFEQERLKQNEFTRLLNEAGRASPDAIVLPETPWSIYLNRELRDLPKARLEEASKEDRSNLQYFKGIALRWYPTFSSLARKLETYIVIGAMSLECQPLGVYPKEHRYNSAFVFSPEGGEPGRYDKIHLVLFGEYVPFRYWKGLHWFYNWLNSITPWGASGFEYSLSAGRQFDVFTMNDRAGGPHRFGITICYEDVIPQVFSRFVSGAGREKRVDFMLNISNDGWFGHGPQQSQHLVNCAFRAIENRIGIARSVNTGVSGFIRPDGSWYEVVGDHSRPYAGGSGYRVAQVMGTPTLTFYSQHGDVFGLACSILALAGIGDAFIIWRRIRKCTKRATASE